MSEFQSTRLLEETYSRLLESLNPEASLFNDPDMGLSIEIDDEDDSSGTLHYMTYEFPITKAKGSRGNIEYYVGKLGMGGKTIAAGIDPHNFQRVLDAIDSGEVKPSASSSSVFSKVARTQPGQMVPVYYINPHNPRGEYIEREREYMTNSQAEKFILDMYRKVGNKIFLKGEEGKENNPLRGYATDNANFKDKYSQYWDLSRWMSKMNMADFRGGHKASNIIGKSTT